MTTSALPAVPSLVLGHHHSLLATTTPSPTTASNTSLFPITVRLGPTPSHAQFPPTSPALHHPPTRTTTALATSPPACQPLSCHPPTTAPPTFLPCLTRRSRWSLTRSRTTVCSLVWDEVGLRRLMLTTQIKGFVSAATLLYNMHTLHTCNSSSPGTSTRCTILKLNPRSIESQPRRLSRRHRAQMETSMTSIDVHSQRCRLVHISTTHPLSEMHT